MGIHRGIEDASTIGYLINRKLFGNETYLWMAKLPYDLHRLRDMGIFYPGVLVIITRQQQSLSPPLEQYGMTRRAHTRFSDLLATRVITRR